MGVDPKISCADEMEPEKKRKRIKKRKPRMEVRYMKSLPAVFLMRSLRYPGAMTKTSVFSVVGILLAGAAVLWAQNSQSMPGLQTSFPIQGHGLQAVPTPAPTSAQTFPKVLRPFHPTPTPVKGKFYPLKPLPSATPSRSLKTSSRMPQGPVTVLAPRNLNYHSLYQDPTPAPSR